MALFAGGTNNIDGDGMTDRKNMPPNTVPTTPIPCLKHRFPGLRLHSLSFPSSSSRIYSLCRAKIFAAASGTWRGVTNRTEPVEK
jgi:hypothetical protein